MEISTSLEDTNNEMIVKRVSVPVGLEELMAGLTKEVMLKKPRDIHAFASEYFAKLLHLRDKGLKKIPSVKAARSISRHYNSTEKFSKSVDYSKQHLSRQPVIRSETPIDAESNAEKKVKTNKSFLDKRKARRASKENVSKGDNSTTQKLSSESSSNGSIKKKESLLPRKKEVKSSGTPRESRDKSATKIPGSQNANIKTPRQTKASQGKINSMSANKSVHKLEDKEQKIQIADSHQDKKAVTINDKNKKNEESIAKLPVNPEVDIPKAQVETFSKGCQEVNNIVGCNLTEDGAKNIVIKELDDTKQSDNTENEFQEALNLKSLDLDTDIKSEVQIIPPPAKSSDESIQSKTPEDIVSVETRKDVQSNSTSNEVSSLSIIKDSSSPSKSKSIEEELAKSDQVETDGVVNSAENGIQEQAATPEMKNLTDDKSSISDSLTSDGMSGNTYGYDQIYSESTRDSTDISTATELNSSQTNTDSKVDKTEREDTNVDKSSEHEPAGSEVLTKEILTQQNSVKKIATILPSKINPSSLDLNEKSTSEIQKILPKEHLKLKTHKTKSLSYNQLKQKSPRDVKINRIKSVDTPIKKEIKKSGSKTQLPTSIVNLPEENNNVIKSDPQPGSLIGKRNRRSISVENINSNKESSKLKSQSSFDAAKLREELKEAQNLTSMKLNKLDQDKTSINDGVKSNVFTEVVAALKIQTLWRGFKVRKAYKIKKFELDSKGVDKDINNTHELKMADAVLKIQCLWRGFKIRQRKQRGELFGFTVEPQQKQEILRTAKNKLSQISAAARIQALWRGYKVRSNVKKVNQRLAVLQKRAECDETPEDRGPSDEDIFRAASKIQAGARGYIVRKKRAAKTLNSISEENSSLSDEKDAREPQDKPLKSYTDEEERIVRQLAKSLSMEGSRPAKIKHNSIETSENETDLKKENTKFNDSIKENELDNLKLSEDCEETVHRPLSKESSTSADSVNTVIFNDGNEPTTELSESGDGFHLSILKKELHEAEHSKHEILSTDEAPNESKSSHEQSVTKFTLPDLQQFNNLFLNGERSINSDADYKLLNGKIDRQRTTSSQEQGNIEPIIEKLDADKDRKKSATPFVEVNSFDLARCTENYDAGLKLAKEEDFRSVKDVGSEANDSGEKNKIPDTSATEEFNAVGLRKELEATGNKVPGDPEFSESFPQEVQSKEEENTNVASVHLDNEVNMNQETTTSGKLIEDNLSNVKEKFSTDAIPISPGTIANSSGEVEEKIQFDRTQLQKELEEAAILTKVEQQVLQEEEENNRRSKEPKTEHDENKPTSKLEEAESVELKDSLKPTDSTKNELEETRKGSKIIESAQLKKEDENVETTDKMENDLHVEDRTNILASDNNLNVKNDDGNISKSKGNNQFDISVLRKELEDMENVSIVPLAIDERVKEDATTIKNNIKNENLHQGLDVSSEKGKKNNLVEKVKKETPKGEQVPNIPDNHSNSDEETTLNKTELKNDTEKNKFDPSKLKEELKNVENIAQKTQTKGTKNNLDEKVEKDTPKGEQVSKIPDNHSNSDKETTLNKTELENDKEKNKFDPSKLREELKNVENVAQETKTKNDLALSDKPLSLQGKMISVNTITEETDKGSKNVQIKQAEMDPQLKNLKDGKGENKIKDEPNVRRHDLVSSAELHAPEAIKEEEHKDEDFKEIKVVDKIAKTPQETAAVKGEIKMSTQSVENADNKAGEKVEKDGNEGNSSKDKNGENNIFNVSLLRKEIEDVATHKLSLVEGKAKEEIEQSKETQKFALEQELKRTKKSSELSQEQLKTSDKVKVSTETAEKGHSELNVQIETKEKEQAKDLNDQGNVNITEIKKETEEANNYLNVVIKPNAEELNTQNQMSKLKRTTERVEPAHDGDNTKATEKTENFKGKTEENNKFNISQLKEEIKEAANLTKPTAEHLESRVQIEQIEERNNTNEKQKVENIRQIYSETSEKKLESAAALETTGENVKATDNDFNDQNVEGKEGEKGKNSKQLNEESKFDTKQLKEELREAKNDVNVTERKIKKQEEVKARNIDKESQLGQEVKGVDNNLNAYPKELSDGKISTENVEKSQRIENLVDEKIETEKMDFKSKNAENDENIVNVTKHNVISSEAFKTHTDIKKESEGVEKDIELNNIKDSSKFAHEEIKSGMESVNDSSPKIPIGPTEENKVKPLETRMDDLLENIDKKDLEIKAHNSSDGSKEAVGENYEKEVNKTKEEVPELEKHISDADPQNDKNKHLQRTFDSSQLRKELEEVESISKVTEVKQIKNEVDERVRDDPATNDVRKSEMTISSSSKENHPISKLEEAQLNEAMQTTLVLEETENMSEKENVPKAESEKLQGFVDDSVRPEYKEEKSKVTSTENERSQATEEVAGVEDKYANLNVNKISETATNGNLPSKLSEEIAEELTKSISAEPNPNTNEDEKNRRADSSKLNVDVVEQPGPNADTDDKFDIWKLRKELEDSLEEDREQLIEKKSTQTKTEEFNKIDVTQLNKELAASEKIYDEKDTNLMHDINKLEPTTTQGQAHQETKPNEFLKQQTDNAEEFNKFDISKLRQELQQSETNTDKTFGKSRSSPTLLINNNEGSSSNYRLPSQTHQIIITATEKPPKTTDNRLVHTGEFHDTITVPITLPATPPMGSSSPTGLVHTGEIHDAIPQGAPPAGAPILTSHGSKPASCGAQASLKDASTCGKLEVADGSGIGESTSVTSGMESEKRNNSSIQKKSMEAEAAIKIQAGFRGYQVRKQLKNKVSSPGDISNQRRSARRKSSGRLDAASANKAKRSASAADLEEQSAVKIQAGIRGFLVRQRQKNNKPDSPKKSS